MKKIILVTGTSSGFGALAVRALAKEGHIVYASMLGTGDKNVKAVAEIEQFAAENKVDLRAIELDVKSQDSADAAIVKILKAEGRLDVIVHNAGHMVFGAAEAFTPEQFADLYDTNVIGTQRVNRAALPHLRKQRRGLLVWISSSSTKGGTTPYLAPYFAAKAGMDSLAVSYASELARWGIETSIVVPGAYTTGTNHFKNAGSPDDKERYEEYRTGPYKGMEDDVQNGLKETMPPGVDVNNVTKAIVRIVNAPFGERPFRVHTDTSQDGAEVVNAVADRIRTEYLKDVKLGDLLKPADFK